VATIARGVIRLWRRDSAEPPSRPGSPDVGWEHRFETVEARLERLEQGLEGLQDALYRHEVLQDKNNGELRKRTEPEQLARDLSRDARRRGL
jgi:hypothetical protein